jgi:hypothetical protein
MGSINQQTLITRRAIPTIHALPTTNISIWGRVGTPTIVPLTTTGMLIPLLIV